jgi:hypothetical protein
MSRRKISRNEIKRLIEQHRGNVHAIAAASGCTIKTIYNTIDAYDLRGELDRARETTNMQAANAIRTAPPNVLAAIAALIESTGAITRDDLVRIGVDLPEPDQHILQPIAIDAER